MKNQNLFVVVFCLTLAIASRFVDLPYNFTLFGAAFLFAGCYLRGIAAWLVPLGALAISDWIGHTIGFPTIHFYFGWSLFLNYMGFAAYIAVGCMLRNRDDIPTVLGGALFGSILYFAVSNFGAWMDPQMHYAPTAAGLLECYWNAIPFYRATLASDLFFAFILFGGFRTLNLFAMKTQLERVRRTR